MQKTLIPAIWMEFCMQAADYRRNMIGFWTIE